MVEKRTTIGIGYSRPERLNSVAALDCTIRNVSNDGVALDVASPVGIPEQFTLVLPSDGLTFPCRVVWRKQRRIGVAFEELHRAGRWPGRTVDGAVSVERLSRYPPIAAPRY